MIARFSFETSFSFLALLYLWLPQIAAFRDHPTTQNRQVRCVCLLLELARQFCYFVLDLPGTHCSILPFIPFLLFKLICKTR